MELVIKDKVYQVKFGVAFVRSLDKAFPLKREGMTFGMALGSKIPELLASNIAALSDVLYHGTVTESPRPKQADIDAYVDSVEEIEALFDEVIEELRQSNAGKLYMKNLDNSLNK